MRSASATAAVTVGGVRGGGVGELEHALGCEQAEVVERRDRRGECGRVGLALRLRERVLGAGQGVLRVLDGAGLEDAGVRTELLDAQVGGGAELGGRGDALVLRGDGRLQGEAAADECADCDDGTCGDDGSTAPAAAGAHRTAARRPGCLRMTGQVCVAGGR